MFKRKFRYRVFGEKGILYSNQTGFDVAADGQGATGIKQFVKRINEEKEGHFIYEHALHLANKEREYKNLY